MVLRSLGCFGYQRSIPNVMNSSFTNRHGTRELGNMHAMEMGDAKVSRKSKTLVFANEHSKYSLKKIEAL